MVSKWQRASVPVVLAEWLAGKQVHSADATLSQRRVIWPLTAHSVYTLSCADVKTKLL